MYITQRDTLETQCYDDSHSCGRFFRHYFCHFRPVETSSTPLLPPPHFVPPPDQRPSLSLPRTAVTACSPSAHKDNSFSSARATMGRRTLDPISIWDRGAVLDAFHRVGLKPAVADRVWDHIGKVPTCPLSQVSDKNA